MPKEEHIYLEGRVVELLPGNAVRVELANGHRMITRMSGRYRMSFNVLGTGDTVLIEVSPFDLSNGWILEKK